jgi:hypothetical protein
MFRKSALAAVAVLIGLGSITVPACADTVLFSDDFNSGASPAWSNTLGNWTASGGAYRAQNPNNFPNTYSFVNTLPSLTDFSTFPSLSMLMRQETAAYGYGRTAIPPSPSVWPGFCASPPRSCKDTPPGSQPVGLHAPRKATEGRASATGAVKELLQGDPQSLANDLQRVQIRAPLTTFPAG